MSPRGTHLPSATGAGQPLVQIAAFRLAFNQVKAPAIFVDHGVDVIRYSESVLRVSGIDRW
jgi:hypothetical protein